MINIRFGTHAAFGRLLLQGTVLLGVQALATGGCDLILELASPFCATRAPICCGVRLYLMASISIWCEYSFLLTGTRERVEFSQFRLAQYATDRLIFLL